MFFRCQVCLPLVMFLCLVVSCSQAEENGFEPIFDGESLQGWNSPDMTYWSVEDKAITGKITVEHPCEVNQYLVWQGGELGDFELKLTFRMVSDSDVNGGFQFRSQLLPDHDVAGYQIDNDTHGEWLVRIYDEHGRHTLAFRGQRSDIAEDGTITHRDIPEAMGKPQFRLDQWHTYHLICQGRQLTLKVNGRLMAEVVDNDRKQLDLAGILALQLHSGPPMTVQFKEIELKRP